MLGGIAIASVAQFIGICLMPESPRWLGKAGRTDEQLAVIRKIYLPKYIEAANKQLTEEVTSLQESTKLTEM